MNEFLTIDFALGYDTTLQAARHLTDEERQHVRPEYRDQIFIGVGDDVRLEYIKLPDRPDRPSDGEFKGCGNQAWIITQDEWDKYVALNASRKAAADAKAIQDEITVLEARKADAERQKDLPAAAEAARRVKEWIAVQNEGGEGYVPHIYSAEEYEKICARLEELKKRA